MEERLLDIRIQLEELITRREGMLAANKQVDSKKHALAYDEKAFADLASDIADLTGQIYH